MKFKPTSESIKRFLWGFVPSKYILLVMLVFYVGGVIFAYLDPLGAGSVFKGGFLLGNLTVQIATPSHITWNYFLNQFVYYLGAVSRNIFLNNLQVALQCIFSGFLIIPTILVGSFSFIGAVSAILTFKVGVFKAFLILSGCLHIYFEFLAGGLIIEAFFKFYGSILNSIGNRSYEPLKQGLTNKFMPLLLRIILLLAVGAILEVFWSTWWVYILTNHYVSWIDFYFGVYSAVVY